MSGKNNKKNIKIIGCAVVATIVICAGIITLVAINSGNDTKQQDSTTKLDNLADQSKRQKEESKAESLRLVAELQKLEKGYFPNSLADFNENVLEQNKLDNLTYALDDDKEGFTITYRSFDGTTKTVHNEK